MRRAFLPALRESPACHQQRTCRVRPTPVGLTLGAANHQNTRRRFSKFSAHLSHNQTHPIEKGNKKNTSKFSHLVDLVEDTATGDQTVVGGSSDPQTQAIREAFRNTPLFSSAAHDFVESTAKPSAIVDRGTELSSQYALIGALQRADRTSSKARLESDMQDRLVLGNLAVPWSALICGSQGSGKTHTLTCLLENALMSHDPDAEAGEDRGASMGSLRDPLAAIVFHYDGVSNSTPSQLCEAAYLCSNGKTPVAVLVSASNFWAMRWLYHNLPGLPPEAPRPRVLPMYFSDNQLSEDHLLRLLAVNPMGSDSGADPLYMSLVREVPRDMAMGDDKFTYAQFREKLSQHDCASGESKEISMHLKFFESFIEPNSLWTHSTRPAASPHNIWDFQPGSLTIVDLTDPFLSSEEACALFSIALSIFMEQRTRCGGVVAIDNAHKFLAQNGEAKRLVDELASIMRQQRHNDTRVMIATEEPTQCPELADLADATFMHRSLPPAGLNTLHNHLGEAHIASNSSTRKKGSHGHQLIEKIARLGTGETLVFCPAAHLSVKGVKAGKSASGLGSVVPLGDRFARVKIRRRLTAEPTSGDAPAESADTDEVPMFVVEADKRASSQDVKARSYNELGEDYRSIERTANNLARHVSSHLNEILRPMLIVDEKDEAWSWKELTRTAFRGLEKKLGLPENDIQYYPSLCRDVCEVLDQSVRNIKIQLVEGKLDKPSDFGDDYDDGCF